MTKDELKNITSNFLDILPLLKQHNDLLKQTNKNRKRLKTKLNYYSFLLDIVAINNKDKGLVNSLIKFFKAIEFDKIENVDKNIKKNEEKKEDIRIWFKDLLIIIEVSGSGSSQPKYKKAHQISMHIPIRQQQYPNHKVFGLSIINHDNKKHFSERNTKPFTKEIQKIAKSHKYTLITTVDLLNYFIQFKNGTLTKTEFIEKLCVSE